MPDSTPITEPGVYDIDADVYHRDPVEGGSLSSSGARKLLPPGCPALFRYEREHPPEPKPHFDVGHAAHRLVLGMGPNIHQCDVVGKDGEIVTDWRTKAAQEWRDQTRAAGGVPLLIQDWQMVHDMADALAAHPLARLLFDPDHGTPEATLVWDDDHTGTHRRCRLDWLPSPRPGHRLIIPDYKTCHHADLDALSRATWDHGYAVQDAWNRAGCEALDLTDRDTAFLFVFQEKTPPYLVSVVQLDHTARQIGDALCRQALDIYARCQETGRWPDYVDSPDPAPLSLPTWVERMYEG